MFLRAEYFFLDYFALQAASKHGSIMLPSKNISEIAMMRRPLIVLALGAALFIAPTKAVPQMTPQTTLASIIGGLQSGVMNWNRFYPDLKSVIAAQTNGTGRYPQLAALGPIQNIIVLGGWQLPSGYFYTMRVFFMGGAVDWQLAADFQGNIAGLSFYAAQLQSNPTPPAQEPTSAPSKPAPVGGGGGAKSAPKSADDACSLYPDLC